MLINHRDLRPIFRLNRLITDLLDYDLKPFWINQARPSVPLAPAMPAAAAHMVAVCDAFHFDADSKALSLSQQPVKVYFLAGAPDEPWFQAKPLQGALRKRGPTHIVDHDVLRGNPVSSIARAPPIFYPFNFLDRDKTSVPRKLDPCKLHGSSSAANLRMGISEAS